MAYHVVYKSMQLILYAHEQSNRLLKEILWKVLDDFDDEYCHLHYFGHVHCWLMHGHHHFIGPSTALFKSCRHFLLFVCTIVYSLHLFIWIISLFGSLHYQEIKFICVSTSCDASCQGSHSLPSYITRDAALLLHTNLLDHLASWSSNRTSTILAFPFYLVIYCSHILVILCYEINTWLH